MLVLFWEGKIFWGDGGVCGPAGRARIWARALKAQCGPGPGRAQIFGPVAVPISFLTVKNTTDKSFGCF